MGNKIDYTREDIEILNRRKNIKLVKSDILKIINTLNSKQTGILFKIIVCRSLGNTEDIVNLIATYLEEEPEPTEDKQKESALSILTAYNMIEDSILKENQRFMNERKNSIIKANNRWQREREKKAQLQATLTELGI